MGFVLIFRLLCWVLLGKIFDKVLNLREACLQRGIVLWPFYCCTNRQRPLGHEEFIHFATFFHRGQISNHFAKPQNCTKGSFTLFKLSKLFTTSRNVQQNPVWYTQKVHQMVLALFKYFNVFRHHYCFQKFCKIMLPQEIYIQQNPICQAKNLH